MIALRKSTALILIVTLLFTSAPLITQAESERVALASGTYVVLEDVAYLSKTNGVRFTVKVVNNGSQDLDYKDFWYRVVRKNGSTENAKLISKDISKVSAGTTIVSEYYAEVSGVAKLSDLSIRVIKWDFSSSTFVKNLGHLGISTSYDLPVEVGKQRAVISQDSTMSLEVEYYSIATIGESNKISLSLSIENKGNSSIKMPTLNTNLFTSEELYYPLTAEVENLTLLPRTKETVLYTGTTPNTVSVKDMNLVVSTIIGEGNVEVALAQFLLPKAPSGENTSGSSQMYNNKNGKYEFTLLTVQRHPWQDEDILSAQIRIKNKSNITVPIPELSSNFYLDGIQVDTSQVKAVNLDKVFGIKANGETDVIITTKIPYTYTFSDIRLELQEKMEDKYYPIASFTQDTTEFLLPDIELGKTYYIDQTGRKTEVTVKSASTYNNTSSNSILTVIALEYKNLEKRSIDIQNLVAYLHTKDGVYLPAEITEYKEKVQPDSSIILSVSAKTTSQFTLEGSSLVIGQGITEGVLAETGSVSDAYINSALMVLPEKESAVSEKLTGLSIYPYEFNFRNIKTYVVDDKSFKVELEYDMINNLQDGTIADEHNLILEIIDNSTKTEQRFVLNKTEEENNLVPGEKQKLNIILEDENYFYFRQFNNYTINIYDEYKEYRKKIASKELKWFVMSE
jgi:hypothetical protein